MDDKKAYQEKWHAKIEEWKAKIDVLEAKATQAKADLQIEYKKKIEDLRGKEEEARERLNDIKKASSDAWSGLTKKMEAAARDLKEGIEKSLAKFK